MQFRERPRLPYAFAMPTIVNMFRTTCECVEHVRGVSNEKSRRVYRPPMNTSLKGAFT
jgi:hypothetical protein